CTDTTLLAYTSNSLLTEISSNMRRMASANNGAMDSTLILGTRLCTGRGIVLVTTISLMGDACSRSAPGSDKTGCVAAAYTSLAPWDKSASAALTSVPPVSTMSSMRMAVLPCTSPMTCMTSATLGCG